MQKYGALAAVLQKVAAPSKGKTHFLINIRHSYRTICLTSFIICIRGTFLHAPFQTVQYMYEDTVHVPQRTLLKYALAIY
jgi:hypothetical protein